ncbi:MAG: protein-S-isoprenylcysteine O-methyltransferase [Cyanobacteria bacterium P01_F01_bin.150]
MERPFVVIYLLGVCIAGGIRVTQSRKHRRSPKPPIPTKEFWLMLFWFLASQLLPAIFGFHSILSFANYPLPISISVIGIGVMAIALWLLRQSHLDLNRNWSPIAEIQPNQVLITHGIYRYIRHPMYGSHLLWGVAQGLLIPNWLVGWAGLLASAMFCGVRIPKEEALMQKYFGNAYMDYRKKVGAIVPKLFSI